MRLYVIPAILLSTACVSAPVSTAESSAQNSACKSKPISFDVNGTNRVEDMLASNVGYLTPQDYLQFREPFSILSSEENVSEVRVLISDRRFSSVDRLILKIEEREICEGHFERALTIITEGEMDFPSPGVIEESLLTYRTPISEKEFTSLMTSYSKLIAAPVRQEGGFCDHCFAMRIDSHGIEGAEARSLFQGDQEIVADSYFAEEFLKLAAKKFPALADPQRRISKTLEVVRAKLSGGEE